jgi:hypothetical protein
LVLGREMRDGHSSFRGGNGNGSFLARVESSARIRQMGCGFANNGLDGYCFGRIHGTASHSASRHQKTVILLQHFCICTYNGCEWKGSTSTETPMTSAAPCNSTECVLYGYKMPVYLYKMRTGHDHRIRQRGDHVPGGGW